MTHRAIGTVTTNGFEICGNCHEYLSTDNPGEWTASGGCALRALLTRYLEYTTR